MKSKEVYQYLNTLYLLQYGEEMDDGGMISIDKLKKLLEQYLYIPQLKKLYKKLPENPYEHLHSYDSLVMYYLYEATQYKLQNPEFSINEYISTKVKQEYICINVGNKPFYWEENDE